MPGDEIEWKMFQAVLGVDPVQRSVLEWQPAIEVPNQIDAGMPDVIEIDEAQSWF